MIIRQILLYYRFAFWSLYFSNYFVRLVLVKYDLKGLNNTISVLQISGLDPKKVPLMAY